jgi:hypothetical protein
MQIILAGLQQLTLYLLTVMSVMIFLNYFLLKKRDSRKTLRTSTW